MKNIILCFIGVLACQPLWAGPITKIQSLSTKYNTEVIEITWESTLAGGCENSNIAVTNPDAQNNKNLVSMLYMAYATNHNVEVVFGGNCGRYGSNWIQTIKIHKN